MMMMMMMMMMDCRYQEFRPFTVSGHEKLSISQGTLYAKERFHLMSAAWYIVGVMVICMRPEILRFHNYMKPSLRTLVTL